MNDITLTYASAMPKVLKVFYWGLLISFLGTLPLGTLNVTATQIAVQESVSKAVYFAIGCLITEMVFVRLSLVGISWVRKQVTLMKAMEWITLAIIIALAIGSFIAATRGNSNEKNAVLNNEMPRLLLGMFMSALNPVQIPFWFGWSTVLFQKGILSTSTNNYNIYITGIGVGTFVFTAIIYVLAVGALAYLLTLNNHFNNFLIIQVFFLPVLAYFFWWFNKVYHEHSAANFVNTMRMNLLASICTNAAFITLFLIEKI